MIRNKELFKSSKAAEQKELKIPETLTWRINSQVDDADGGVFG